MDKTSITERLNSIRNEMTHIWGAVFILGGGAISLLVNEINLVNLILGGAGIAGAILLSKVYIYRRIELLGMLKKMEEKE